MIQMFLCLGDKYRRYRCRPTYNTNKASSFSSNVFVMLHRYYVTYFLLLPFLMLTFALYTHQGQHPTCPIHSLIHSPVALSQYHTQPIFHPHYHTHSHSLLHSNLALHSTTTKLMSRRNAIDPAVREAMSVSLCISRDGQENNKEK